MNEKMQWLKINNRTDSHTILADKWKVRNLIKTHYDDKILTSITFQTYNWKDIVKENMPDYPFIIKPNHASGWYHIIHDKNKIDWKKIRQDCRFWLSQNYYLFGREWQYKNIKPCLLVEKLLIPASGSLPNNYRLHCLSGKVEIISVNICFENPNVFIAKKFDSKWNELNFRFGVEMKNQESYENKQVNPPKNLALMIEIAEDIAKNFAYLRVDFYEVDEKLYFSEITFHDSGGYDRILPFEWDTKFGQMIHLNQS